MIILFSPLKKRYTRSISFLFLYFIKESASSTFFTNSNMRSHYHNLKLLRQKPHLEHISLIFNISLNQILHLYTYYNYILTIHDQGYYQTPYILLYLQHQNHKNKTIYNSPSHNKRESKYSPDSLYKFTLIF